MMRPLVKILRAAAKRAVNTPTIASRHLILLTEYKITVDSTGIIEAQIVPTKLLKERSVS